MATPMPNDKSAFVQVRLTGAEKRRVQAAAAQDGRTVSEWLREPLKHGLHDADTADGQGPSRPVSSRRREASRRR